MKFQFEKFGYVDKGTVELGDLTIICGPNNVGKTYVSYSIYGFISNLKSLIKLPINIDQIQELKNRGAIVIDLNSYQQKLSSYLIEASKNFNDHLEYYFGSPYEFFQSSNLIVKDFQVNIKNKFEKRIKFGQGENLIFDKELNSQNLFIVMQVTENSEIPNRILETCISEVIVEYLFLDSLPEAFVVTSERTGISLFYKEMDIYKSAILDNYLGQDDKFNPVKFLNETMARYARPIQDNIDVIRDHERLSKHRSFIQENKKIYKPILDILTQLLGGNFKLVNGQVFYLPQKERNRSQVLVPFYLASSAVKSMFLLDLYINCLAEKNGLLIIDEPELNLHPDNQRKMASLLARLVNAGVKVLITTHSDYIIRELNNRIMLSNNIENKEEIMNKNSILMEDILLPKQVKAFVVKNNHSIQEIVVDKYGINFQIFDDLIADSNKISDDIYYNIKNE